MASPSLEVPSERLRLALPLMARHGVPVSPANYWVWYEYVVGNNGPLRELMDQKIDAGEPIGEAETMELFRRFVAAPDPEQVLKAEQTVLRLLESVAASLTDADSEVSRYEAVLGDVVADLTPDLSTEHVKQIVDALMTSTHRMHEGSAMLHGHLEDSREEVAALKAELQAAKRQAKTDPLTQLVNRIGLDEAIEELRADAANADREHAILVVDIDRFKRINDSYGHLFGDKILKVVADALRKLTKGKDVAARFGGEEFVILLTDTRLDGARAVAESIRESIQQGRIFNPKTNREIERITVSVGVTGFRLAEGLDAAVERADDALYRAKNNGRNRVETHATTAAAAVNA